MWSYFKLITWGFGWFILWVFAWPLRHERHNCLTWAVDKWNKDGGYLVIRWSRHHKYDWLRWPHFLWLDEKHHELLVHVIPPQREIQGRHILPQPWFELQLTEGDPKDLIEN